MATKRKSLTRKSRRNSKPRARSTSSNPARAKKSSKTKYVYYFGDGYADGTGKMKPLLGGKGANLAEMTRIGLPVPPGFTITTEVCSYFYAHDCSYPPQLKAEVEAALAKVEKSVGKKLGDKDRPLLVSVRSGARDSMPGMMDTILNLGMNDEVVEIVAKKTGNARFAWDSYRRFLQMYGDVVMGVQKRAGEDHEPFESAIEHLKDERYGKHDFPDVRLKVDDLKELVKRFKGLMKVRAILEQHFKDMQDLEFTVEEKRLYILQTRNGKRTGHAAVRIAVDMVEEKLITEKEAVRRIPADSLAHLLAPIFDRQSAREAKKIGSGLAAGPGAACGHVVFSAEEAVARSGKGQKVVLARVETSPEDLRGMIAAEGILTTRGGVSSHAALVARQMGKVCVCGASGIRINYQKRTLSANGTTLSQGDYISIDGTAGEVFAGEVTTAPSEIVQVLVARSLDGKRSLTYREYEKLMTWADEFRTLGVRTNADTPEQVTNAIAFGAEGIGLCRTEHMFFEGDRIDAMREMILAGTKQELEK